MRRGLRAPTPSSALPTRARTAVRAPTFTPAKIPVVDTLKSRYASTSGEGGLNTLATFLFGMSSAKWEMPADAPRLSRESWDVTGSASPGQGPWQRPGYGKGGCVCAGGSSVTGHRCAMTP